MVGSPARKVAMSGAAHHSIPLITPGGATASRATHGVPCEAHVGVDLAELCFPLKGWHAVDFRHGAIRFGAPRTSHRLHAGVDILAPRGTPLYAIADGFIRQAPYYFYEGTNAIEVVFPGVGVARYGEVATHQDPVLRARQAVKKGDLIGHVGRLNSGHSMLHFELYQGRESTKDVADFDDGGLSQKHRAPYQRHPNLVDPTNFMWALHERTASGR